MEDDFIGLRSASFIPVGLEPCQASVGQRVFGHLCKDLVGYRGNIGPGPGGQGAMQRVADAGRHHQGLHLVVLKYRDDVGYQVHTCLTDVIQASDERADYRGPCLSAK